MVGVPDIFDNFHIAGSDLFLLKSNFIEVVLILLYWYRCTKSTFSDQSLFTSRSTKLLKCTTAVLLLWRNIFLDEGRFAVFYDFGPIHGGPVGLDYCGDYQGKRLNWFSLLVCFAGMYLPASKTLCTGPYKI